MDIVEASQRTQSSLYPVEHRETGLSIWNSHRESLHSLHCPSFDADRGTSHSDVRQTAIWLKAFLILYCYTCHVSQWSWRPMTAVNIRLLVNGFRSLDMRKVNVSVRSVRPWVRCGGIGSTRFCSSHYCSSHLWIFRKHELSCGIQWSACWGYYLQTTKISGNHDGLPRWWSSRTSAKYPLLLPWALCRSASGLPVKNCSCLALGKEHHWGRCSHAWH